MLKKAGIVTAGVTAGLLAVSPLAFAGDGGHGHGHGGDVNAKQVNNIDQNDSNRQSGLINVGDVNALNNANVLSCSLNSVDIAASVLGVLGGQAVNGEDAPAVSECSPGSTSQTNIDG
ncbi:hypothetical protein Ae168Ps1_2599c [Pseudonocardia sp. Ae168_Ps1]|uniref:hypothetical protein n=1 Tax=unclassified Pseudonocardia TaxID=2619320 RepID=UPI00094B3892|nr:MULTISPECIES: hypothetical protein [unclassified Pseudonocardia]OLL74211.1 hypothetical protein Ae150APs1_2589c [Pseudonocardia sp. Ae150A_Ps1]OLL80193.1 hypothetical protein Ae168Ps1_2599c [Pseudonocardia sp. Ae168_Ps1]OLL85679.1 hypothetical protein Ae263Ps1_2734 [Pseudonocardia sp. Ae263_Ps1]OLL94291.1 hypothetical protein Ae356Ps1_4188c [Pseudonocardia sp. Ae356_Ps1]